MTYNKGLLKGTNCLPLALRGLHVHTSCGLNLLSTRVMIIFFKPEVGGREVGYQMAIFFNEKLSVKFNWIFLDNFYETSKQHKVKKIDTKSLLYEGRGI